MLSTWLALDPELREVFENLDESIERACAGAAFERASWDRDLERIARLPETPA